MMMYKAFVGVVFTLLLSACSHQVVRSEQVSLPLLVGWYNGETVFYVTTDVSDRDIAKAKNANYAPRLIDAVPQYPKPPSVKTVLERVYAFPNGEQSRSVFASIPRPLGYENNDQHYSPLWLMYVVAWKDKTVAHVLTSENAILDAEDKGLVTVTRTKVVLNCPMVKEPKGN